MADVHSKLRAAALEALVDPEAALVDPRALRTIARAGAEASAKVAAACESLAAEHERLEQTETSIRQIGMELAPVTAQVRQGVADMKRQWATERLRERRLLSSSVQSRLSIRRGPRRTCGGRRRPAGPRRVRSGASSRDGPSDDPEPGEPAGRRHVVLTQAVGA